jgi:hypothetical protein
MAQALIACMRKIGTTRSDTKEAALLESTVGALLANAMAVGQCEPFYWRERNREVNRRRCSSHKVEQAIDTAS